MPRFGALGVAANDLARDALGPFWLSVKMGSPAAEKQLVVLRQLIAITHRSVEARMIVSFVSHTLSERVSHPQAIPGERKRRVGFHGVSELRHCRVVLSPAKQRLTLRVKLQCMKVTCPCSTQLSETSTSADWDVSDERARQPIRRGFESLGLLLDRRICQRLHTAYVIERG